jgi:hypothetical protein
MASGRRLAVERARAWRARHLSPPYDASQAKVMPPLPEVRAIPPAARGSSTSRKPEPILRSGRARGAGRMQPAWLAPSSARGSTRPRMPQQERRPATSTPRALPRPRRTRRPRQQGVVAPRQGATALPPIVCNTTRTAAGRKEVDPPPPPPSAARDTRPIAGARASMGELL